MANLVAEKIHFRHGRQPVLRGVDFTARDGESVVLFGINGAGKSTLLNLLSTRYRMQAGLYLLNGRDAAREPELLRAALLYVGHHTHLYGHLTAVENLRFFTDLRDLTCSGDQLMAAVNAAGLAKAAHRPVRGFSAGMRKRLALARMLLTRPSLLLLDEPYSSLDTQGVTWLNELLRDYTQQGGTLVMATHDPERVAALAPRVLRLENGRLAQDGEHPPAPTDAALGGFLAVAPA